MTTRPVMLTPPAAGRATGWAAETIRRWIRDGRIPPTSVERTTTGRLRVDLRAVRAAAGQREP